MSQNQNLDLESWAKVPFKSQAEIVAANRDPRKNHHSLGAEYDAAYVAKMAITNSAAIAITGVDKNPGGVYSYEPVAIETDALGEIVETRFAREDAVRRDREEYGRLMGRQAIERSTLGVVVGNSKGEG